MSTSHFYATLPAYEESLSRLLDDESHFADVPADWHVIVTDIKGSTNAFRAGRHEEVNLIATGSIIAVLNLAKKAGLEVPFFFGGDGASIIVPGSLLDPALKALGIHRENTLNNFSLDLRVGSVPVESLMNTGSMLKLSRLAVNEIFSIPVLLGEGLSEAERRIKAEDPAGAFSVSESDVLDLEGMECRWDRVEPDVPSHEVVSLVVTAAPDQAQALVFKQVVDLIDSIYGSYESRNPVSVSQLKLSGSKIGIEMRTRLGKFDLWYLMRTWFVTLFGRLFYLKSTDGQYYIQKLVELTDTLVIDGKINTVIAGTNIQRKELERQLSRLERAGLIKFGLFVSEESVMSCYVSDRRDKHIHFVDGADGGYTMAATMWKKKRRPT